MIHPKTGDRVRTEWVCEANPPEYEHDMETVKSTWAEHESVCKHCGFVDYVRI
jgi:hypothetical protein